MASSVLSLLFALVLIRTKRTTNINFITVTSILLMTSSLFNFVQIILSLDYWRSDAKETENLFCWRLAAFAVAQASLQSGHWWFCFEYLECAVLMPYNVKNEKMPDTKRRFMNFFFYFVLFFQVLLPCASSFDLIAWTRQWFNLANYSEDGFLKVLKAFFTLEGFIVLF